MTSDIDQHGVPSHASDGVASVLAALGQLMKDLREQDLALQNAVSELAAKTSASGTQLVHIQHIDLITQTHDDLARFLPELAACLEYTKFDEGRLTEKLRLQSLKDQLLDTEQEQSPVDTGDLSLF